jgi:hypothetical protein
MTAFPKYIIKRLIPEDAVKLVNDEIHVTIVNVLATIPFDKVPADFVTSAVIKVDGVIAATGDKPELIAKIKLIVKGKTYPITKIKDIEGGELPPGETMTLVLPNIKNFKKGEMHSFEATIQYRPKKGDLLIVAFDRKIN